MQTPIFHYLTQLKHLQQPFQLQNISIEDDEQETEDNIQDIKDNHHQNPHNQSPKKDPNKPIIQVE